MKIKKDFITNSSSTSFIIISQGEILEEDFLKLLGVQVTSDFYEIVSELYDNIINEMEEIEKVFNDGYNKSYNTIQEFITEEFSEEVYTKYMDAKKNNKNIYFGTLRSEGPGELTSFFCCEHFLEENEKIYFNYTNCYW